MQEINAAYDEIMNREKRRQWQQPYRGLRPVWRLWRRLWRCYGGYGGGYQRTGGERADGSNYFNAARNYIQFGRYREALNVLASIQERNAEWYYLSAVAHAGAGNRVQAQQHAQQAVRMAPGNPEYRELYERLQQPGQTYTTLWPRIFHADVRRRRRQALPEPVPGAALLRVLLSAVLTRVAVVARQKWKGA